MRRPFAIAALAALLLRAPVVLAQGAELSEEKAKQILPRADLTGLGAAQRAQFLEIAGDTFDYAGCNDTLARCLQANVADRHALRMADLVKAFLLEGYTTSVVIEMLERYYASFPKDKRQKLDDKDCAVLGDPKSPVAVVEFSDFQCPHCATAAKPLHEMVSAAKGRVKLCSKNFPLPGHPRAAIAAACAEWARKQGKFWEMSELLFEHQEELDDAQLKGFAQGLGLDGAAMLKDVYAGKLDPLVERHKSEGVAAGVRATPTVYFNGRQFTLPLKTAFLLHAVKDEEEWQRNKGGFDKD